MFCPYLYGHDIINLSMPGVLNIKMPSYQYRISHYKYKGVFYLYNWNLCTQKKRFLYL